MTSPAAWGGAVLTRAPSESQPRSLLFTPQQGAPTGGWGSPISQREGQQRASSLPKHGPRPVSNSSSDRRKQVFSVFSHSAELVSATPFFLSTAPTPGSYYISPQGGTGSKVRARSTAQNLIC